MYICIYVYIYYIYIYIYPIPEVELSSLRLANAVFTYKCMQEIFFARCLKYCRIRIHPYKPSREYYLALKYNFYGNLKVEMTCFRRASTCLEVNGSVSKVLI